MIVKNKIMLLLAILAFSNTLRAQTGGPGQPEFMQFKPATVSELVDPSTGSFSYSIPLFDVGGYPINLSYQSGIGMEDVASIVGLGWNINVGAISHNIRGLPDDFEGDPVARSIFMKPYITYGGNVGIGMEIAGFKIGGGLNLGMGLFYNNYNGYGVEESIGLNLSASNSSQTVGAGLSLGMKANSQSGIDIWAKPSVSVQSSKNSSISAQGSLGGDISINSREGLKTSINVAMGISNLNGSAPYSFSKTPEIPRVSYPFTTECYEGNFKVGGEVFFMHPHGEVSGYYSSQKLSSNAIVTPAYGFLYADKAGQNNDNILHDFNREKDEPYIKNASVNIGIPYYTNDIYSVNAQGINGSFKLNRGDIGVIFNNAVFSGGNSLNIGMELGAGNALHMGTDISTTNNASISGKWKSSITPNIDFGGNLVNNLYQCAYFKNSSDVAIDENDFYGKLGKDKALEVALVDPTSWGTEVTTANSIIDDNGNGRTVNAGDYIKSVRDPRTINIQYKTAELAALCGLSKSITEYQVNNFGCNNLLPKIDRVGSYRQPHHISEMTSTNTDGMRYVFGLPTYNITQKEVCFTLEKTETPLANGQVLYNPSANWGHNGRDGFYESTTLPPYVTSHLLTAVLSPEYIDVDSNGPSINDIGNYVKINYSFAGNYRWRTPYGNKEATFNKAFLSDNTDNKASYVYGEKELWYTHSVESKTEIAEFYYDKDGRRDGLGVAGETGGKDLNQKLYKLDSIKVYSINERVTKGNNAEPIRSIYFTYDYELCQGILNSSITKGKLTLKKVSFASGKSKRELLSPYQFSYGDMPSGVVKNPLYNPRDVNRFGNFQKNIGTSDINIGNPLSNIDFPYASQNETEMTENSYAWNLTRITLPSSGTIKVQYEPNHYAYTQDNRCMQMFPIEEIMLNPTSGAGSNLYTTSTNNSNYFIKFKLQDPIVGNNRYGQLLDKYFNNDLSQYYYYKALVNLKPAFPEWITGYYKINSIGLIGSTDFAYIEMKPVCRGDGEDACGINVNPIAKNAWQFLRLNRYDLCFGDVENINGTGLKAFLQMGGLQQKISEQTTAFFKGFNKYAQEDKGFAATVDPTKSFLRLYSPKKNKIIGGSRVKTIISDDNWKEETGNASESKTYTTDYEYTNIEENPVTGAPDTVSSGVMEYEPFNGQDENPLRQPVYIDQHIKMPPDNRLYVETPFNESLFPGSNLTYAKVKVISNKTNLNVPGTGFQEIEHYTAKDFPVLTDLTKLGDNHEKKTGWLASFAMSIFGMSEFHDYITLSQGFSITLNDMHGKQKATRNYNGKGVLISSEDDIYKIGSTLNLINDTNHIYQSDKLGISASAICDSRSTEHKTEILGVDLNMDMAFISVAPAISFVPVPSMSLENTRINTVAFNKIIEKKGILVKKTVTENGAAVSTENLVFDDKTGDVVLSKTTNEFNDTLFKFQYPAHWIYKGLAAGYLSSDLQFSGVSIGNNYFTIPVPEVFKVFTIGDEIVLPSSGTRYWITEKISPDKIKLESAITGNSVSAPGPYLLLRPGRRNQLELEAGSVVTHVNPLLADRIVFSETGSAAQVINSSMQEFSDLRIKYCSCEKGIQLPIPSIAWTNPFATGERGNWYPSTSWSFLTDRERSVNVSPAQTNIRVDGSFVQYKNFWNYQSAPSDWTKSITDWQWVETVSKKDVNGLTLETKDVLNRHNSLMTGYKDKLVVGEAGNARINEILFDGFEDWSYLPIAFNCIVTDRCILKRLDWGNVFVPDPNESHSGKYSGKLKSATQSVTITVKKDTNTSVDTCIGKFVPFGNKRYIVSAWVRENGDPLAINFSSPTIQIGTDIFNTSGNIIDGWQRIYGEFTTPIAPSTVNVTFTKGAADTWFDDIRIFPFDATIITHVFDGNTQKLTFTLDENNYFTKFNYDASDNLESVNKETEKGVQTIKEARSAFVKRP